MSYASKMYPINFADPKEAENQLNAILAKVEKFIGYNIVNNGHNSSIIIFTDAESEADEVKPQVKIVSYSITNTEEAEKAINEALKDIKPIRLDVATPIDGNRLIILYDTAE